MADVPIFHYDQQIALVVLARLGLALLCGAALGFERRDRPLNPAGVRTMALVTVGAAVFMLVSLFAFGEGIDTSRVAAQVVSGIGFLGGGIMFLAAGRVRNLTTAATFWLAAAVGLAAGGGQIVLATAGTAVGLALLYAVRLREMRNGANGEVRDGKQEEQGKDLEKVEVEEEDG
jgi:putative Mg2+ transporter-C (MgtC) family protein